MKASEFKKGQRVKFQDIVEGLWYIGTVVGPTGHHNGRDDLLDVMRDDGFSGGGEGGSWVCVTEVNGNIRVELLDDQDARGGGNTTTVKHRMGIDREEINQEKYSEFMKGLG